MRATGWVQILPVVDNKGDITGVRLGSLSVTAPRGESLSAGAHVVRVDFEIDESYFRSEAVVNLNNIAVDPTVAVRDVVALSRELHVDDEPF